MDDNLVAGLDVGDVGADFPDDARAIAAAGMEVLGFALFLAHADDVQGLAQGGPHGVEIDPRGHDVDQHFVGLDLRRRQHLTTQRILGLAEAVLANRESVHVVGHLTEGRAFAECANIHGCLSNLVC